MRLIDADFEVAHWESVLLNPTPDVTEKDHRTAPYIIDALKMAGTVKDAVEVVRCKDCKHFELDHWADLGGVKLITAHQICNKWSDGCMTDINGYCFLGERRQP